MSKILNDLLTKDVREITRRKKRKEGRKKQNPKETKQKSLVICR